MRMQFSNKHLQSCKYYIISHNHRYTYDRQYDKALGIYLELKKGPVFELIRDFNLFDAVKDKVLSLVNFDKEKAVQLLVTNPDRILVPLPCFL